MKYKNIRYVPGGGAEFVEHEIDEPGPGQVQIENTACGICSWDLQTFRVGTNAGATAPPGHEGVGYVTKLGPGVTDVEVGQRVVPARPPGNVTHPYQAAQVGDHDGPRQGAEGQKLHHGGCSRSMHHAV